MIRLDLIDWTRYTDLEILRRKLIEYEHGISDSAARGWAAVAAFQSAMESASSVTDPDVVTFIAYDDKTPVGYIQISRSSFLGMGTGVTLSVNGWWVEPEYRPKVGGILARAAMKTARRAKSDAWQAMVVDENKDVHHLLQSHGWRPVATVYEYEVK